VITGRTPAIVEAPANEASWLDLAPIHPVSAISSPHKLRLSGAALPHRASWRMSYESEGADAFTLRAEAPEDWKQLHRLKPAPTKLRSASSSCGVSMNSDRWRFAMLGTDGLVPSDAGHRNHQPCGQASLRCQSHAPLKLSVAINDIALAQGPSIGLMRVIGQ